MRNKLTYTPEERKLKIAVHNKLCELRRIEGMGFFGRLSKFCPEAIDAPVLMEAMNGSFLPMRFWRSIGVAVERWENKKNKLRENVFPKIEKLVGTDGKDALDAVASYCPKHISGNELSRILRTKEASMDELEAINAALRIVLGETEEENDEEKSEEEIQTVIQQRKRRSRAKVIDFSEQKIENGVLKKTFYLPF